MSFPYVNVTLTEKQRKRTEEQWKYQFDTPERLLYVGGKHATW